MKRTKAYYNRQAAEILSSIRYATLATVTADGKPWNTSVSVLYDSDLNMYWVSDKESQHSRNVRVNGAVFIVMYDSTVPEGKGQGLYIQARAHELTDAAEIRAVRRMKKGPDEDDPYMFMEGGGVRRVYKAEPEVLWVNDAEICDGVFIRDYRLELSAADIKHEVRRLAR